MKSNRAELAVLRGKRDPQALSLWVQAFAKGSEKRAKRYALAVASFLGQPPLESGSEMTDYLGQYSPNTQKAYAFAVTEFFEWVAAHHGKITSPDDVTRLDAEQYVNWLSNRPFSLAEEKLKDGDLSNLLVLYETVNKIGSATLQDIIEKLPKEQKGKYGGSQGRLNRQLISRDVRKLVTMDVLQAQPTMETLREQFPQAGISRWELPLGDNNQLIPLEDVFVYQKKEYEPTSRTTVAQRVSALSSFWHVLMQGENVSGGEALLKYDVWSIVKKRVNRGLAHLKKEAAREQKMPSDKIIQMMRNAPTKSLVQLRNRAILYLMVFMGVRTTEILLVRRGRPDKGQWKGWFEDGDPPKLRVLRKGNKWQSLPYPSAALKPLFEFQKELEARAAPSFAQHEDRHGPHYIPREETAWYYRDLLLPDAPLFPPLSIWGNNRMVDYRKSMSRIQCYRLLRRVAEDAGLSSEEVDQVHPHAIRHFAANAMIAGGKDIREVQTILGHSTLLTTESYLEDIDEEQKLSGQDAILQYMETQGMGLQPQDVPFETTPVTDVVETTGIVISDETVRIEPEELQVLQQLEAQLPTHSLPQAPEYDPDVVVHALPRSPAIVETKQGLVGVDGEEDTEVLLEDLAQTVKDGWSPGSPAWVYETMSDPQATRETVVFNRGGEPERSWLLKHYPKTPKNFGVGHESYLPWYVRVRGNVTRSGYFKGMPPFPVYSPDQSSPETTTGEEFIEAIEREYSRFVHGDVEKDIAPSPIRSSGMIRWYSFFVYHAQKLQEAFSNEFEAAVPQWYPWNASVPLRNFRAHDDAWLVQWLVDNAHTYRASVEAMRKMPTKDVDLTSSFLKSAFEGIELITDVPEWMIENDPIKALFESDPKQWKEMIRWLKNATGKVLDADRKIDRTDQEAFAIEEQKTKARKIRDILMSVVHLTDRLSFAKHQARDQVKDFRRQLRAQLYWYATAAGGVQKLNVSLDTLQVLSTKEFNQEMAKEYKRLGVPNPNLEPYRSLKGRQRAAAIVAALFPDIPELTSANVFEDSRLFNPKWFEIDEKAKTVFLQEEERLRLQQQYGQDPQLLLRRALRALWEARDKGQDAMKGIMLSYFSWIIPPGKEMESQALGIPVVDLGDAELNREARKNWLKAWSNQMKRLAMGQELTIEEAPKRKLAPWEEFLQEESRKDALDYIASDSVDFAMSMSVSGGFEESPEELLMQLEETDDYYRNRPKRGLIPNRRGTYVHLEGENPKRWYAVDFFGKKQGNLRPNAPPLLMSPGVVYRAQKRVFPARQLLPSPFRMIVAMYLR